MDIMWKLARNLIEIDYANVPTEVVGVVKRCIMDTLATTIAGTTASGCGMVVDLVKEWGGKGESSIVVYGGRVPCANAALANTTMARALDLDDCHDITGVHPGVATVPSALAMAEQLGNISGKELITAIALGSDLICRLLMACKRRFLPPWSAATCSPFGSTAVAGKMLGLDEREMMNALGLAYCQAANTFQGLFEGVLSLRLMQGLAAKAGIVSALLARKGFTGPVDILQGKYGFYPVFVNGEYDPEVLTAELGKTFEIANVSVKLYPTCKQTHSPIEAALEIVTENGIHPDDIEDVTVHVSRNAFDSTCDPLERKRNPRTVVDAQFSIPYTVATAIVKKEVFIGDFTDNAIRNPQVLRIAKKVKPVIDPEIDRIPMKVAPSSVEIRMKDGRVYSKRVDIVRGVPQNPISMENCREKFEKCLPYAAKPLPHEKVEEVLAIVSNLEQIDDVTGIVDLLVSHQ